MCAVLLMSCILINADFPICAESHSQYYPYPVYANSQFYVFWGDRRDYSPYYSVYAARVTESGTVLDPDGKLLYKWQAGYEPTAAFDGTNFLVTFRDSC